MIILQIQSDGLYEDHEEAAEVIVDEYVQIEKQVVPAVDQHVKYCKCDLPEYADPPFQLSLVSEFVFEVLALLDGIVKIVLDAYVICQLHTLATLFNSATYFGEAVVVLADEHSVGIVQVVGVVQDVLRQELGELIIDVRHEEERNKRFCYHADFRFLRYLNHESGLRRKRGQDLHGAERDVDIATFCVAFHTPLVLQKCQHSQRFCQFFVQR